MNRCATRVGKLLEAEADWPWKQFLTNTQSILKLKLGIHPIRAYLKRERLLSSLPGRMDIVARAIVQIVRKDPAQYFFIEISESILRSLALSLKKSDVEFGGVPIRRLIEDSKSFKDCRSFFPQMQQRLSFLRDNVPAVISALPQNESIQLDIDSVRAFVNSVIWTSPSEADIVRMLAEAIIKNPKAYFSRVRAPASEERSYPSSTRSRPDPAMC